MPIGKIDTVMTSNEQWAYVGLGVSGETYIINSEHKLVNNSRFFIEDKAGYMTALKKSGTTEEVINNIKKHHSSVGTHKINSVSANNSLKGQSGSAIVKGYMDVPVLSAYALLDILGLNWGILDEINETEAFAALTTLKKSYCRALHHNHRNGVSCRLHGIPNDLQTDCSPEEHHG